MPLGIIYDRPAIVPQHVQKLSQWWRTIVFALTMAKH